MQGWDYTEGALPTWLERNGFQPAIQALNFKNEFIISEISTTLGMSYWYNLLSLPMFYTNFTLIYSVKVYTFDPL